jgi:uncharacterized membrane protein YphA (DoxX/SURF4 family)
MVWDADGLARLDRGETLGIWEQYYAQVARHYGFNDEQKKVAERIYTQYSSKYRQLLADNSQDIDEYRAELTRLNQDQSEESISQVASLAGQANTRAGELRGKRGSWLGQIDAMWKGYERDLNNLAVENNQARRGFYPIGRPGRRFLDSVGVDGIVRWFDVTVGVLLVLGLFTRATSIVAALFLLSVVATQPPWVAGAAPTYYQVNLMLACLVLAATGAGRFAGLDTFIHYLRFWCCPPKRTEK